MNSDSISFSVQTVRMNGDPVVAVDGVSATDPVSIIANQVCDTLGITRRHAAVRLHLLLGEVALKGSDLLGAAGIGPGSTVTVVVNEPQVFEYRMEYQKDCMVATDRSRLLLLADRCFLVRREFDPDDNTGSSDRPMQWDILHGSCDEFMDGKITCSWNVHLRRHIVYHINDPADHQLGKEAFLPMTVKGKAVLVHVDGNSWRIDNTDLRSCSDGLAYRQSKQLDDKMIGTRFVAGAGAGGAAAIVRWGTVLEGTDAGEGWLQTQVVPAVITDSGWEKMDERASFKWSRLEVAEKVECGHLQEKLASMNLEELKDALLDDVRSNDPDAAIQLEENFDDEDTWETRDLKEFLCTELMKLYKGQGRMDEKWWPANPEVARALTPGKVLGLSPCWIRLEKSEELKVCADSDVSIPGVDCGRSRLLGIEVNDLFEKPLNLADLPQLLKI